jgi:hypothetical protein
VEKLQSDPKRVGRYFTDFCKEGDENLIKSITQALRNQKDESQAEISALKAEAEVLRGIIEERGQYVNELLIRNRGLQAERDRALDQINKGSV